MKITGESFLRFLASDVFDDICMSGLRKFSVFHIHPFLPSFCLFHLKEQLKIPTLFLFISGGLAMTELSILKKVIRQSGPLENKVGLGGLQSSVQQSCVFIPTTLFSECSFV